jgi:Flp pilus assembly protein TadD
MKPERNDPCPCGSGKKYKKCCGASAEKPPATAHVNLRSQALAAFQRGSFAESIEYCRKLLQIAPSDFDAYHLMGLSELQSGHLANAIKCLAKAVQLEPRNPFALNNLAYAHHSLGEYAEAERCAHSALAIDPKLADAHNNLGLALAIVGRCDEAVAAHREATQLMPENALFRCNLAGALFQRGDMEGAEREYHRTLEMAPQFGAALAGLGTASLLRKNWTEARTLLEKAIAAGERKAVVFRTHLKISCFDFRRVRSTHQWPGFERRIGARGAPYIILR